jgi:hypothetical protein
MLSDRASRPDVAKYCTVEIIAWVRELEPLWARLCSTGVFVGVRTGVVNPATLNIEAFPFAIWKAETSIV